MSIIFSHAAPSTLPNAQTNVWKIRKNNWARSSQATSFNISIHKLGKIQCWKKLFSIGSSQWRRQHKLEPLFEEIEPIADVGYYMFPDVKGFHRVKANKSCEILNAHNVKMFIFSSDSIDHPTNFCEKKMIWIKLSFYNFRFTAILVYHSHQSSLNLEWVVT